MKHIPFVLFLVVAMLWHPAPPAAAAPPERSRYIVVLHDDEPAPAVAAREIAGKVGGEVGFIYQYALKGFSIAVPEPAVAGLERNPRVKYIAPDDLRYAIAQATPTGVQRIFAAENTDGITGNYNTSIYIDGSDNYRVDVDVAVIDTGIDLQHPDLQVMTGVNCTGTLVNAKCVAGGDDDHYHGTHVAGIIGALDNGVGVVGVAPGARLWPVKVMNSKGSGYSSWIIAGIDWIAKNAATIEVANMSLGGPGYSQAEHDAIQGAVNAGVAFAVAAGNDDADAGNYSPAAFDNVLTVSALADFDGRPGRLSSPTCFIDQDDTLAYFSNWGSAVDIAAPGACILSTYPIEKGSYGTLSGTSMASPHVAGALALLASAAKPAGAADVTNLYAQVENAGNSNWGDDSGDGLQEPLLDVTTFAPALIATGGAANTAPIVSITNPADGVSVAAGTAITFTGTAIDTEDGDLSDNLIWFDNGVRFGTGGSFSAVLSGGTHTITATAADAGGLIGNDGITVTVAGTTGISLNARAYKVKSVKSADLTWSGAASSSVDIRRNGTEIATTANDGAYTDKPAKNTVSATYQVCENGTTTCSNSVTVNW